MKTEYGLLTMEISPELAKELISLFNIEVEMMQGKVEDLANDLKRFTIRIPKHKGGPIKEFLLSSIIKSSNMQLN
ncbi:MAG: hypothetical protein JWQ40_3331 [Segetibacter sp.]|jgi:hypothetical protein|nr:hypothetical protein [Segetibacter sp.]